MIARGFPWQCHRTMGEVRRAEVLAQAAKLRVLSRDEREELYDLMARARPPYDGPAPTPVA